VIEWLTGFDDKKLTFETFFAVAKLNPNAHLIKGVICGYRIEEIKTSFDKKRKIFRQIGG
jgi:hypothetical protein